LGGGVGEGGGVGMGRGVWLVYWNFVVFLQFFYFSMGASCTFYAINLIINWEEITSFGPR